MQDSSTCWYASSQRDLFGFSVVSASLCSEGVSAMNTYSNTGRVNRVEEKVAACRLFRSTT